VGRPRESFVEPSELTRWVDTYYVVRHAGGAPVPSLLVIYPLMPMALASEDGAGESPFAGGSF
jgi:hypothetical protein